MTRHVSKSGDTKSERTTLVFAIWRLTEVQSAFMLLLAAVPADEYLSAFVLNFNVKSLIKFGIRLTNKSTATSQIPDRWWQAGE